MLYFAEDLGDAGPGRENYPDNVRHENVFVELGSKDAMVRNVLGMDSVQSLSWDELMFARGSTGDLRIALFHAQRGELVRKLVPAYAFTHAERELRAGWARRTERQRHPEQCELSQIIVTVMDGDRIPGIAVPRRRR